MRALWVLESAVLVALALSGEQASAHLGTHNVFTPIFSGAANVERTLPDRAFWTRPIHVYNEGRLTPGIPVPVSIGYASYNTEGAEWRLGDFLRADKEAVLLNRKVFVRKDHYLQKLESLTKCVLANLLRGVRFLGEGERGVSLTPGRGLLGGRMTYVPCPQIEADDDEGVHYDNVGWCSPRESEPRSLSDIHLIELIAHNSQLLVHDLPLIVCKHCINNRGERGEGDERLQLRSDSKIIERIQYIHADADQLRPGEPRSRHSIWLQAAICLFGLMFVEKGLQWITRKDKVIGVLGLFSLCGGMYLLWIFGLNIF